jgi:hypothetical protein
VTSAELLDRIRDHSYDDLINSPYAKTLRGSAAAQFAKLAEEGRLNTADLEILKPIALAGLSIEIKSLSGNFQGENEPLDDKAVVAQAAISIEEIYAELDQEEDDE